MGVAPGATPIRLDFSRLGHLPEPPQHPAPAAAPRPQGRAASASPPRSAQAATRGDAPVISAYARGNKQTALA
eukprot:10151239-Lingulodinium_polyedra.AAC.1